MASTTQHQISNLRNLEILSLGLDNIAGPIPPAIFNSSTLMIISLDGNQLSGHLPLNIGLWLPDLEQLYLGENQLSGSIPISISNASQLTVLDIPTNSFSGSISDTLGYLTKLQILNLEFNNLTSSGMSFLSSLTSCRDLEILEFHTNPLIGGEIPGLVGNLSSSIQSFSAYKCNIKGSIPRMSFFSSLTSCRDLEILEFHKNPLISGEIPGLVGNLSSSIQSFSAYKCNIKGSIPSEIGNPMGLISIELDNNKLTGMIPTTIGGLKELQDFSLEDNGLEGSIPSELCHLKKLTFLLLTSNKLSGSIPACLGDLISLRKLLLGSNRFSSSIPSTLTGLNYLLILNLSSNSLSGRLPIAIGKWKVVTNMDLSNNQFSSDIPTGVGDLKDLTYFSLSNNRLKGSIPECFGDFLSLNSWICQEIIYLERFLSPWRNSLISNILMSLSIDYKEKFLIKDHLETSQLNH
ncbi:hypothetical protein REPUB_Repub11eG0031100 [Reevesia pubescens]